MTEHIEQPVKNKTNNPNGRPKGTTNKLRVTDFFNGEERDRLVLEAKMLAFGDGESKPDKDMVKFLFEQLFGKAKQTTIQEDGEGNQLAPLLVKILKDGNRNSN
jgi:hypothetical protein